jgi:hypothetical protein
MAGLIFAVVAALLLCCGFLRSWTVIIGDWFRAEMGKLGRPRCRWWSRPFSGLRLSQRERLQCLIMSNANT